MPGTVALKQKPATGRRSEEEVSAAAAAVACGSGEVKTDKGESVELSAQWKLF